MRTFIVLFSENGVLDYEEFKGVMKDCLKDDDEAQLEITDAFSVSILILQNVPFLEVYHLIFGFCSPICILGLVLYNNVQIWADGPKLYSYIF